MKGLSPLIATILLIAFTIAIGGLISVFLTTFTKTQTGQVETLTQNQTKCAGVYIDIESVSGSTIKYLNPTAQQIVDINITTSDGTYVNMSASPTILNKGQSGTVSFTRGTNTSVVAIGLCLNSVLIKGTCESTQYCWK